MGKVTPIFKGEDRSLPKNYRPIVRTSHYIKLSEKIIVKFIRQFMDKGGLYNEYQHVFSGDTTLSSNALSSKEH